MTITMIIAIIAAVIFSVFCFLCVYFLSKNLKDNKKSEERLKTLEYKMGLMGELINQKTDMLAERMSEQDQKLDEVKAAGEAKENAVAEVSAEDEISLDELFGDGLSDDDFEDVLTEDEELIEPEPQQEPVPAAPVEPITPPQEIIEERFDIGKSGKKYTFSELEKLIRE